MAWNLVMATLRGIAWVLLGFVICCFFVYPPRAHWNDGIGLSDLGDWIATCATAAAVVVALFVAGRDARLREAERLDARSVADFRTAMLLQPAFITLRSVAAEVHNLLGAAEQASEPLYLTDGIDTEMGTEHAYDLRVLNCPQFKAVGELEGSVGAVSKHLATPVLCTIAWARQVHFVLENSLIPVLLPADIRGKVYRIDVNVMPGVMTTIGFLIGYLDRAIDAMATVVGQEGDLPETTIHPKLLEKARLKT